MSVHQGTDHDGEETDLGFDETEELSLSDDEDRLPWLESGDYDDEEQGVDSGRIIGFALLGLLLLAVLIGSIWWLSHRQTKADLVADGSTIEAPAGPAKEKPENPGGKTFAGTGDVAPAVGEGETFQGRLAENDAPKPSIAVATPASVAADAEETSGVGVQVGAYSTRASAEKGWTALGRQTDAIKGFKHRVIEGQADIGVVFRLQAVAADQTAAKNLCDALKADGLACQVK